MMSQDTDVIDQSIKDFYGGLSDTQLLEGPHKTERCEQDLNLRG